MTSHVWVALILFVNVVGIATCSSNPLNVSDLRGQELLRATMPERDRVVYEALGQKFMVVSQGEATTRAGREMMLRGGNVVDAAVAASFAISVERPQSTGLAGGGFMLVHLKDGNQTIALDFREQAPLAALEKMFQDHTGEVVAGRSTDGALASGTPGTVAGLIEAHRKWGKLPLAEVIAPAVLLAENGVTVYPHLAAAIEAKKKELAANDEGKKTFFDKNGAPLKLGAVMKQPNLAKVLRAIAAKGREGFYNGWVAAAIVKEQSQTGGLIKQNDLDRYAVKARVPVTGRYGPFTVLSMPPPSSGGAHVIEILNILEGFPLKEQGPYDSRSVHITASAMQLAYLDRSKYLGDSDFVKIPLKGLTSDAYADELRKTITLDKAKKFKDVRGVNPAPYESHETTHFTIADSEGNVVASTQTINGWFGSGVVVPGTGLVMNNQMDDFSSKPGVPNKFGVIGGTANAIASMKRPLSSMSPTIVLRDGNPVMALGSPSGSQIITCVTMTILNYLTYEMPLYDAVSAVRYHHQWTPDEIIVEPPGFSQNTTAALKGLGYEVRPTEMGCKVQAVAYDEQGLRGVSDPRGEGLAAGEGSLPTLQPLKPQEFVPKD